MSSLTSTLQHLIPSDLQPFYLETVEKGNLRHRSKVSQVYAFCVPFETCFGDTSRAWYIRDHCPDRIPPDRRPGVCVSDRTLSIVFCYLFYTDPVFAEAYMKHLDVVVPSQGFTCPSCT